MVESTWKMTPSYNGYEKTCDECGKRFCRIPIKIYKYVLFIEGRKHYYCSYPCWLKAKNKIELKRHYRRMR